MQPTPHPTTIGDLSSDRRVCLMAAQAIDYAMIVFDLQGRIVEWSNGAEHLLGWNAPEAVGQHASLIFTAEDRAAGLPDGELDAARVEGRAAAARWHLRKDGTRIFLNGVLYPIAGPDKTLIGLGKVLRDITERKLKEDIALRQASLLDLSHDAILTWQQGSGLISYWNRGAEALYGYAADEAIGQPGHVLLEAEFSKGLGEVRDALLRTGWWEGEVIHRAKNGRRLRIASRMVLHAGDGGEDAAGASIVLETNRDVSSENEARQAIQNSEERFRSLVMATTQIVWTTDAAGRARADSPSWRAFTGQGLEEYRETGWLTVIHPDDREDTLAAWRRSIGSREIFETEYRLLRCDGEYRWMAVRGIPILNADGTVREWVGANTDITRARQAADALRASEERLHFAMEAGSMAAWDWNLTTGACARSDMSHEILGLASGSPDDFMALIHPGDREWVSKAVERARRAEIPYDFEYRIITPDGRNVWVSDKARMRIDPADGQPHLVGVCMDITARKKAEERLRLLDAVGEATRIAAEPQAIMRTTTQLLGEYLDVTRCAYADVEDDNNRFTIRDDWTADGAQSTAGLYSLDLFGPRTAADMRSGRTLVVRNVDLELGPAGGADMFNAIGVKAIICCPLVKAGRLVAMMAVHQSAPRNWIEGDVALVEELVERSWAHIERVRAAEALREADRRKDEFLATLAHELRNPLAPISTGLELLKLSPPDMPSAIKAREVMERQLAHMVRLIDDLLDVSRISRGKVELRRERLTVDSVIDSALEGSRPLIEANGHTLSVRMAAEPLVLDADPTRMAQAVNNLLNNAAKYTPRGGHIDLSALREGAEVVIRVADTGVGIAPDMLPKVFELFTQVGGTLHRAQGGLGIGLSLTRRLMEMHGGTVIASSGGPGQGSAFTIRLPMAAETGQQRPAGAHGRASGLAEPGCSRILVVDDNVDAGETLSLMLELFGHDIETVHNGTDAIASARARPPQIVFLDLGLPDMSGYQVARHIRAEAALGDAVLVALTGWGSDEDKRKSRDAGFSFHLTKPVTLATIEQVLAQIPDIRESRSA